MKLFLTLWLLGTSDGEVLGKYEAEAGCLVASARDYKAADVQYPDERLLCVMAGEGA